MNHLQILVTDKSKKYLDAEFTSPNFDSCFSNDGPSLWNSLPDDIRLADSLASFRNKLKVYLFIEAYPS